jgi:hypothetical protein
VIWRHVICTLFFLCFAALWAWSLGQPYPLYRPWPSCLKWRPCDADAARSKTKNAKNVYTRDRNRVALFSCRSTNDYAGNVAIIACEE